METTDPVVIVSADSHVGPRMREDLRPYCPLAHLDEFDEMIEQAAELRRVVAGVADVFVNHPNFKTDGHHDSAARLADYDYDGVAAGLLFHGSQNFEPMPFGPLTPFAPAADPALVPIGMEIYNRWLADFVAQAPDRHIGLAYVPMDDIDAAVQGAVWAHEHGLKAINFPAMRGDTLEYNNPAWDPFWATCEERGLPIVTHVGAAGKDRYEGPESFAIRAIETGTFYSHRAVWWLIYGGVFERFPGLKHVIAETPGNWYPGLRVELDAIWDMFSTKPELNSAFFKKVPEHPSEYMGRNVFFGASFTSPYEAEQAVLHGFTSQLLWGSDYPHVEGTFVHPDHADMPSVTKLALRNTFCQLPPDATRQMVGANAIDVFGLDGDVLQAIADRIGAPSIDELTTPIDAVPEGASLHAFRAGRSAWS